MNYTNKSSLRKKMLDARDSMDKNQVVDKSGYIIEKLKSIEMYSKSDLIMCYINFRNEVITKDFLKENLTNGKRIAIPLVSQRSDGVINKNYKKDIIPCEIKNMDTELERGTLGILEPKREYRREINPEEIDLVIVPGIAFDINKNRIGFGAGYYDRFLKKIRKDCMTIGIAFDYQVLDEIPVEEHDMPLDIIITEKRVIL